MYVIFREQLAYDFILSMYWVSSENNYLADALSRDREAEFLAKVTHSGFLMEGAYPRRIEPGGVIKNLTEVCRSCPESDGPSFWQYVLFAFMWRCARMFCACGVLYLQREACGVEIWPSPCVCVQQNAWNGCNKICARGNICTHGHLRLFGGGPKAIAVTTAAWAHMHHDLPVWASEQIDQLMDTRLAISSMRTVNSALVHWKRMCEDHDIPIIIPRDHPSRGSWLALFVLQMLTDTSLVYQSIDKYVWGVCHWQKLQHMPDPRNGVMHWQEFMSSVKVVSWVPSEPREMMPYAHVEAYLLWAKGQVEASPPLSSLVGQARFEMHRLVQFSNFLLILLFSFSRSECPCPKNFTGPQSFDHKQHWQVADCGVRVLDGVQVMRVRMKVTKTDQLMERAAARGTGADPSSSEKGDWVYIGRVTGEGKGHFDLMTWYMWLLQLWGTKRAADEPLFTDKNMERAYTYSCACADIAHFFALAMPDEEVFCTGIHSIRVLGYNLSKEGNGLALTVAHGGWESDAHSRYERFQMSLVANIAANMVGSKPVNPVEPRHVSKLRTGRPSKQKVNEAGEPQDLSEDSSDNDETVDKVRVTFDKAMLPDGYDWVVHDRDGLTRSYKTVSGPSGEFFSSRAKAWDHSQRKTRDARASNSRIQPRHASPTMTSRRASISPQQAPKMVVAATTSRQLGKLPSVYVPSEATRNSRALRSLAESCEPCSSSTELAVIQNNDGDTQASSWMVDD